MGVRSEGTNGASVSDCLPLAAPIGLLPLLILTLCGPERVLVVSTEPLDDLSCLTTPGVGRPGDGAVARAIDRVHPPGALGSGRALWVEKKKHLSVLRATKVPPAAAVVDLRWSLQCSAAPERFGFSLCLRLLTRALHYPMRPAG